MESNFVSNQAQVFPLSTKVTESKPILFKTNRNGTISRIVESSKKLPEVLFIASYPNRECGIATFTQDLIKAIKDKFGSTYSLRVCALEGADDQFTYPEEVKYILKTQDIMCYYDMAQKINDDEKINIVVVEHEFGLFSGQDGANYM